jgi:hypothetical protein
MVSPQYRHYTGSDISQLPGLDFKDLFNSLNRWVWVNWRWIMFFSQVLVSILTLGFCFYMIAKYGNTSQKAYWPIVTIIVGCEYMLEGKQQVLSIITAAMCHVCCMSMVLAGPLVAT